MAGDYNDSEFVRLREAVARIEERQKAEARAADITAEALTAYKATSNEWRQALNDQRSQFATRTEVIAIVSLMLLCVGTVVGIASLILTRK